ncbi:MAG: hypothetical protein ABI343_05970 [Burkholderiaceae bacterium]
MEHNPAEQDKEFADTVQEPAGPPDDIADTELPFAPTEIDEEAENSNDWWSESSDGRCSESAALFAASQPAPLSIV